MIPATITKNPIVNHKFTLYSWVIIAPIIASNDPIPIIIQEIIKFFFGVLFLTSTPPSNSDYTITLLLLVYKTMVCLAFAYLVYSKYQHRLYL